MRKFIITPVYCDPPILGASCMRWIQTMSMKPSDFTGIVFLDHLWPINPENFSECVNAQAKVFSAQVQKPSKNLGGHGGFSWVCKNLEIQDDDFVLMLDPDSYPVTPEWDQALFEALEADESLGYVSLLHNHIENRNWKFETNHGKILVSLGHVEMFNVTLWRGKMLRNGVQAKSIFYGHVEARMAEIASSLGLRHAYLYDYREDAHPVPHPKSYVDWKSAHAMGKFSGNFNEWLRK